MDRALTVERLSAMNEAIEASRLMSPMTCGDMTLLKTPRGWLAMDNSRMPDTMGLGTTWPWKVYNTTKGATGQVQINGGDGFVATLNGVVANVNGNPNNVQYGTPLAWPQLAVSGNGVIYGYAASVTGSPGTAIIGALDVFYAGTLPGADGSNPQGYTPFLLATITNYAVDGSGNVSFTVSNALSTGNSYSGLVYCVGTLQVY